MFFEHKVCIVFSTQDGRQTFWIFSQRFHTMWNQFSIINKLDSPKLLQNVFSFSNRTKLNPKVFLFCYFSRPCTFRYKTGQSLVPDFMTNSYIPIFIFSQTKSQKLLYLKFLTLVGTYKHSLLSDFTFPWGCKNWQINNFSCVIF